MRKYFAGKSRKKSFNCHYVVMPCTFRTPANYLFFYETLGKYLRKNTLGLEMCCSCETLLEVVPYIMVQELVKVDT